MPDSVPIHGECDSRFSRVREIFEANIADGTDLGAAVAFTLDGESVIDLWGGHQDFDRTREWERDTLVNVYSTTKGMTAICAHQLVESGKLDLDAPVAEYWPEFAAGGKQALPVRYLLSHRAGLPAVLKPLPDDALYDWPVITAALAELYQARTAAHGCPLDPAAVAQILAMDIELNAQGLEVWFDKQVQSAA